MPEGATTATTNLNHHMAAKASVASHGPEEAKGPSPLTAEGSETRWRAFGSRPKTPIPLEFRSDPHSHCSLLKPKESRARISFFGSTKGEQNRIWQWFFGSITDSRPRPLAYTPVDLSCFHPPVRR